MHLVATRDGGKCTKVAGSPGATWEMPVGASRDEKKDRFKKIQAFAYARAFLFIV